MKKLILRTLLLLLLLATLGFGYFAIAFNGLARDFVADVRYTSWPEMRAKYRFYAYYARYYEQLRFNPKNNMFDLSEARAALNSPSSTDFQRGLIDYHQGLFQEALREFTADIQKNGEDEDKLFWLAMTYIRVGELENCLAPSAPRPAEQPPLAGSGLTGAGSATAAAGHDMMAHDMSDMDGTPHANSSMSCSLPLQDCHKKKQWAEKAAETFQKLLENYDESNLLHRWLLNFCYMTINRFPDGVPAKYRINTPFIESFYGKGREAALAAHPELLLEDHARELGVNTFDAGKGVAIEDFNGDGWLDIVTDGTFSGTRYYENDHGLRFIDKSKGSGLESVTQGYMISAADYDNDGRMDLLISRPFQRFHLMHNDGNGKFSDATFTSGLLPKEPTADEAVYTCVTTWADVNNDGKLDVFVAQFGQKVPMVGGLLARKPMRSSLFINQGGGKFRDGTDEFGLASVVDDSVFIGAAFGDYDSDGFTDLFLSSPALKRCILMHNIGGKKFEATDLIDNREAGFTTAFVDVDHDGHPDIFRPGQSLALAGTTNAVFGKRPERFNSTIFHQVNGKFEALKGAFGGGMSIGTMGASYGDLNNDGCYDAYLGTGSPESWMVLPNLLFLGKSSGTSCTGMMENISMLFGAATVQKGHAIAFFDFNNDGLQDIYSSLGGMWPGDEWPNQMHVNKSTTKNSWLKLRLHGTQTNRSGIGATIKVTAANAAGQEIIRTYTMDQKTGFGSAPYLAHIGLMDATTIRSVDVRWPVSGKTKHYTAPLNALSELNEDEGVQ